MPIRIFDWEEEWEWNGGTDKEEIDKQLDAILNKKKNIKINDSFADIIDFNYDLSATTVAKIREGRE